MSDIEKILKTEEEVFMINDYERKRLIDILTMVSAALKTGRLWFNKPGKKYNKQFADFALMMAERFANMPVNKIM